MYSSGRSSSCIGTASKLLASPWQNTARNFSSFVYKYLTDLNISWIRQTFHGLSLVLHKLSFYSFYKCRGEKKRRFVSGSSVRLVSEAGNRRSLFLASMIPHFGLHDKRLLARTVILSPPPSGPWPELEAPGETKPSPLNVHINKIHRVRLVPSTNYNASDFATHDSHRTEVTIVASPYKWIYNCRCVARHLPIPGSCEPRALSRFLRMVKNGVTVVSWNQWPRQFGLHYGEHQSCADLARDECLEPRRVFFLELNLELARIQVKRLRHGIC